jgi:hypothetical protein
VFLIGTQRHHLLSFMFQDKQQMEVIVIYRNI